MDVSVVVEAIRNFESEDAGEEGDGFFEVSDVDKRRDLDEVGNHIRSVMVAGHSPAWTREAVVSARVTYSR